MSGVPVDRYVSVEAVIRFVRVVIASSVVVSSILHSQVLMISSQAHVYDVERKVLSVEVPTAFYLSGTDMNGATLAAVETIS
jgi:hypothetical protein